MEQLSKRLLLGWSVETLQSRCLDCIANMMKPAPAGFFTPA